jgi:hypothetical protein
MYPNKVFEIFNVSTPLSIYVFFDRKWLTCATRAFFGHKIFKIAHIYVLILKMLSFFIEKRKKEKRGWPNPPHGSWGWLATPIRALLGWIGHPLNFFWKV